ncbi:MAG: hypothetical protein MUC92_08735 [Fimbriimonadaceae bacterium]|jgi:hypothetical protein|nr:hypothetical protein [Fimbriimonadaceae bacterium]
MAIISQEVVTRVGRAHLAGQKVLLASGATQIESVEVALAAEAHAWFWRPTEVKKLLVVANRSFTRQSELAIPTKLRWLGGPTCFVRTLPCLAFGESQLAAAPEPSIDPTLWPLLSDLAEFPLVTRSANLSERLEWKVKILRRLQQKGYWIQNPHPFGLAEPLSSEQEAELVAPWLRQHLLPLADESQGAEIVCMGEPLAASLQMAGTPVSQVLSTTLAKDPATAPREPKGLKGSVKPSFAQ